MTSRYPADANSLVTSGGDQRPAIAPEDVGDWHARSGRDGSKGFAGRSLILKRCRHTSSSDTQM